MYHQGRLGRKLLPLSTPGATLAGPPIAAMRDAGRIMPVPLMLRPFVVAAVTAAVVLPRLAWFATGDELLTGALPGGLTVFGVRIVVPVANGAGLAFGSGPAVGGAIQA